MSIYIAELHYTRHAVSTLTKRGISPAEVDQLPHNRYRVARNLRPLTNRQRRTLIGHTHVGRPLTVVIEETYDPAVWLVITGWKSTIRERTLAWR